MKHTLFIFLLFLAYGAQGQKKDTTQPLKFTDGIMVMPKTIFTYDRSPKPVEYVYFNPGDSVKHLSGVTLGKGKDEITVWSNGSITISGDSTAAIKILWKRLADAHKQEFLLRGIYKE